MKVLFCTDGSKISRDALKNFAQIAPKNTVIDTICVTDFTFLPEETFFEGFINSCQDIAQSILDETKTIIEDLGLNCGKLIKHCGSAVESILEQTGYDLIVMGSHGKKGIQVWLGSVSKEVLNSSDTSVYISKEERKIQNVLFTTDGSIESYNSAKRALEFLNLDGKNIYLCTVIENPDTLFLNGTLDSNWLMAIQSRQEKYAEQSLNEFATLFKDVKSSEVLTGIPAQKIIEYSKNMDLIVTSKKKKTKMQKFLSDSVSTRIVENCKCDTLVINCAQNLSEL